jgi:hypothetical protein
MISHVLYADFSVVAKVLATATLAGKRKGKRGSLFDACAPPGGLGVGSLAVGAGSEMALKSQIASAAVCDSARAYRAPRARKRASLAIARGTRGPSRGHMRSRGKTTNEAEALVLPASVLSARILRAPKTWTLKKLGAALISRVAVLLEFVLAVTAASMPIVTLAINGQGRTYLTGRAPSRRSFARGGRRCRSNRPALCRSCCASQARSGLAAAGGPHRSSCHAAKRGPSEFPTTARAQIARAASLAG